MPPRCLETSENGLTEKRRKPSQMYTSRTVSEWREIINTVIGILNALSKNQHDQVNRAKELIVKKYIPNSAVSLSRRNDGLKEHGTALRPSLVRSSNRLQTDCPTDFQDSRLPLPTTPLMLASLKGYVELVEILLSRGEDPNEEDKNMKTPLHLASLYGKHEVCRALLSNGADVNARTHYDDTPLHHAAEKGHFRAVVTLVMHGANVGALNARGSTPADDASNFPVVKAYLTERLVKDKTRRSLSTRHRLVSEENGNSNTPSLKRAATVPHHNRPARLTLSARHAPTTSHDSSERSTVPSIIMTPAEASRSRSECDSRNQAAVPSSSGSKNGNNKRQPIESFSPDPYSSEYSPSESDVCFSDPLTFTSYADAPSEGPGMRLQVPEGVNNLATQFARGGSYELLPIEVDTLGFPASLSASRSHESVLDSAYSGQTSPYSLGGEDRSLSSVDLPSSLSGASVQNLQGWTCISLQQVPSNLSRLWSDDVQNSTVVNSSPDNSPLFAVSDASQRFSDVAMHSGPPHYPRNVNHNAALLPH